MCIETVPDSNSNRKRRRNSESNGNQSKIRHYPPGQQVSDRIPAILEVLLSSALHLIRNSYPSNGDATMDFSTVTASHPTRK